VYNREVALKIAFNRSVVELLGVEEKDYYSSLTTDQIFGLKVALSNINNVITLRLVFSLASWICDRFNISDIDRQALLDTLRALKPNANGYDIEMAAPDIIAEIKCNIPINAGRVYGAAQQKGLRQDIEGLLMGKSKSSKNADTSIKLLGLYDTPEVRAATGHFIQNLPTNLSQKLMVEPEQGNALDNQHVYIVFVK
jgi:hypothetical protein